MNRIPGFRSADKTRLVVSMAGKYVKNKYKCGEVAAGRKEETTSRRVGWLCGRSSLCGNFH